MRHRGILTLVATTALLLGCAQQIGGGNTYPPIPAPLAETVPQPPVSAESLIWQPGYWDWTGAGYTWRPGLYVPAAGHGNLWMPGYWDNSRGDWTWRPPHWTS